jgi:hypothetical protein
MMLQVLTCVMILVIGGVFAWALIEGWGRRRR